MKIKIQVLSFDGIRPGQIAKGGNLNLDSKDSIEKAARDNEIL